MSKATATRLTPAQRRALEWFLDHEPVGRFGGSGPSMAMVRRLEVLGLIERAGAEPGPWGFTLFRTTPPVRAMFVERDRRT
jgi:hypothetical protein